MQLSEQIHEFYRLSTLSELSSRLRFLGCEQVELAIAGMFPRYIFFSSKVSRDNIWPERGLRSKSGIKKVLQHPP